MAELEKKEREKGFDKRKAFVQLACAVYLLYLSWKLGSDVIDRLGEGFTTMNIVGVIAAVVFAGAAVMLIVSNVKAYLKDQKSDESKGTEE